MKKVILILVSVLYLTTSCGDLGKSDNTDEVSTYGLSFEGETVEYSLEMSSIPGLPLGIECHNEDEIELELRVKCDNGSLLVWNIDGTIEQYGGYYHGPFVSTTLYWSPLNDDEIPMSTPVEYSIGIYNYEQDKESSKVYGEFIINDEGKYVVDIN